MENKETAIGKKPATSTASQTAPATTSAPAGETEEQKKIRVAAEKEQYHKDMLKKISATRIPRVVDGILSIGGLATHKPNAAQQKFIIDQLRSAVDQVENELKGATITEPKFQLPE